MEDVHTIVIDSLNYLMDMYESLHVLTATNTMQAWGEYTQFFKRLMQRHVASSSKNVIFIASLDHKPFPVVTVHDEFKCHPNYMNPHYVSMFQELAHSELLSDILSQIHGKTYHVPKFGNVVEKIGKANYALS